MWLKVASSGLHVAYSVPPKKALNYVMTPNLSCKRVFSNAVTAVQKMSGKTPWKSQTSFFQTFAAFWQKQSRYRGIQTNIAKASAPYRGQNRQNREKRASGSKDSHFPVSQKWALWVKKNSHSSTGLCKENGDFFTQSAHFWDTGTWEFFDPEALFSRFLAILTPVGGRRFRNINYRQTLFVGGSFFTYSWSFFAYSWASLLTGHSVLIRGTFPL